MTIEETSAEDVVMAQVVEETDDQALEPTITEQSEMELSEPQNASEREGDNYTRSSPSESTASIVKRPPKMRLKLSMRKLPTQANRKPSSSTPKADQNNSDEDDEIRATVVDSDDGEEHAVAATVVGDEETNPQSDRNTGATEAAKPKRRSVNNPSRQIRLPPIASPGLYMAPPSVAPKDKIAKNGLIAPAEVFDYNMELAGYTRENRTKRPHRGSSVTRTIGDMFDSNVALTVRFPPLIPPIGNPSQPQEDTAKDVMDTDDGNGHTNVRQSLIDALAKSGNCQPRTEAQPASSRKRRNPLKVSEMVPVSLTINYPDEYVAKQVAYVDEVSRRERAIIAYQDALFLSQSSRLDEGLEENNHANVTAEASLPLVPAIPDPPTPPALSDLSGLSADLHRKVDHKPIYLPKGKEDFVAHLDPNCFHITEGRYFGLASNFIADPNFVGPNAPGIAGINASGGSGLATSSSGGGISGAMALTLSTTYNGTTAGSAAAFRGGASVSSTANHSNMPKSSPVSSSTNLSALATKATTSLKASPVVVESKDIGPRPTATYNDLKKIFDDNGPLAHSMKDYIVKAAVHASRSGQHSMSWLGPDGQRYPDISKAFALYAGVKPCHRCKNNKQGAYHCRLRRKHKDTDHDGGDSPVVLSSLLLAPMESLLPGVS